MRLPIFAFLVFSAFLVFGHASIITLNDTNSAVLFSPNWTVASTTAGQNFAISADVGAYLAINLPSGTVSAEYLGFKRNGGSAYGVCLDCVGDIGTFQVIDGHDDTLTVDEAADPVVLFSMLNLDPTAPHTLTVYNLPDVRFAKSGEITFQSIILNTDDGENDNGGDNAGDLGPDGSNQSDSANSTGAESTGTDSSVEDGGDTDPGAIFSLPPEGVTFTVVKTFSSSPTPTPTTPAIATSDQSDSTATTSAPETTSTDDPDPTNTSSELSSAPTAPSTSSTSSTPTSTGSINNDGSPPNQSLPNQSDSNSSISPQSRQRISSTLTAVIVVLSILAVLALLIGLFFFLRRRRRMQQSSQRLPGPEDDPNNNSRTPLRRASSPTIGAPIMMRQSGSARGGVPPERPRNPFEDVSPPTAPLDVNLELEYPGDSTLMKKRMRAKTTSSFGNLLWVPRGSGS